MMRPQVRSCKRFVRVSKNDLTFFRCSSLLYSFQRVNSDAFESVDEVDGVEALRMNDFFIRAAAVELSKLQMFSHICSCCSR